MKHTPELSLPPQLQPDFDSSAQAVHERWSRKSLGEVRRETPKLVTHDAGEQSVRYADLGNRDQTDPSRIMVMPMPIGKNWGPELYIATKVIQEVVMPDGRLIVFPNNNRGQVAYTVSGAERQRLAKGDFSPISDRQLRALESLGITSPGLLLGRSQGATVAARLGRDIDTEAVLLDEAPNTFPGGRSGKAMRKAAKSESGDIIPAYNASGLPAYVESVHADNPLLFYPGLLRFAIGANLQPPNKEINRGFTADTFYEDVAEMLIRNPRASLLLSNANQGDISSEEHMVMLTSLVSPYPGDTIAEHISYEGKHVTAGNPMVMGILGRRALALHELVQETRLDPQYQAASEGDYALLQEERSIFLRAAAHAIVDHE